MPIHADSNATGANDGTSWADAYTTLLAAMNAWRALALASYPTAISDVIWVADDSTESYSSILYSVQVKHEYRIPVYRVDKTTDLHSIAATDGTAIPQLVSTDKLELRGHYALNGVALKATNGFSFGTYQPVIKIENSFLEKLGSANSAFYFNSPLVEIRNSYLKSGTLISGFFVLGSSSSRLFRVTGTTIDYPDNVPLVYPTSTGINLVFEDCKIINPNAISLVATSVISSSDWSDFKVTFINCKLPAGFSLTDSSNLYSVHIDVLGCSSSGVGYLNQRDVPSGTIDTSNTTYLTAGYSDLEGATNLSQVMSAKPLCLPHQPLESFQVTGVVDEVGSKTFSIELLENYTAALTKENLWLELFYYDSATGTEHTVDATLREPARLSYSALTAGAGTAAWTSPPAGSRSVKFELTVTVNKVGFYKAVVHLGGYESGKVVHVDPAMTVT